VVRKLIKVFTSRKELLQAWRTHMAIPTNSLTFETRGLMLREIPHLKKDQQNALIRIHYNRTQNTILI
jgi:hypothetical protein